MNACLKEELKPQKRTHAFAKRLFVNNLLQKPRPCALSLWWALLFHPLGVGANRTWLIWLIGGGE